MCNRAVRLRRRDPGHTTATELAAAMAPFCRPPARTAFVLQNTFIVHVLSVGELRQIRMEFTPSARATLLKHLGHDRKRVDAALTWLERELCLAFYEEDGYATRYTHPQFLAALRALARLEPSAPPPALSPAFLDAVQSNERLPETHQYLPDDLGPLPYDDNLKALVVWNDLGTEELIRRADALFRAVRARSADNWEELARRAQWDPLRQATINTCARLWVEQLGRPASATKPLLAFTLEVLPLMDPTFPRSLDERLVGSIRARLAKALRIRRR